MNNAVIDLYCPVESILTGSPTLQRLILSCKFLSTVPVSFAVKADQSYFLSFKTGVLTATCRQTASKI